MKLLHDLVKIQSLEQALEELVETRKRTDHGAMVYIRIGDNPDFSRAVGDAVVEALPLMLEKAELRLLDQLHTAREEARPALIAALQQE